MKPVKPVFLYLGLCLASMMFSGCESDGNTNASAYVYYQAGWYDPWYYGDCHHGGDIIITPPPDGSVLPPRPAHPIANPTPRPSPSNRYVPRPSLRR